MRVAVLGRTSILLKAITSIENSGHEIVLIGTCKESPEYKVGSKDFEMEAEKRNIPFFCNQNINSTEVISLIKKVDADIAVSMNWISMIRDDVIKSFKYGILNAHPGDLPRYKGNACPNWAIINGEDRIGVTIHFMDPYKLDSGIIIKKHYIDIDNNTYVSDVYNTLETLIPKLYVEALCDIQNGNCTSLAEDKIGLRCYPRVPYDSHINWNMTCSDISKLVRASGKPFLPAYSYINNKKLYIEKVETYQYSEPCLVKYGQIVSVDKIKNEIGVAVLDGVVIIKSGYFDENRDIRITDSINSLRMRMEYNIEDEIYNIKKDISVIKKTLGIE